VQTAEGIMSLARALMSCPMNEIVAGCRSSQNSLSNIMAVRLRTKYRELKTFTSDHVLHMLECIGSFDHDVLFIAHYRPCKHISYMQEVHVSYICIYIDAHAFVRA
jgi:hypothetical protein